MPNNTTKPFCCHLNTILKETYYEQIHGKKGYSLGYYTTYYYLLKEYKKQGQLCNDCQDFASKLFTLYLETRSKHQV